MNPSHSKVILVDDDPTMLRLLSKWLGKAGYDVRCAADGKAALEAIKEDPPDFLVTDWEMPEMDGLQLCREVRQLDLPHYVYILFLTVRSAPTEVVAGLDIGADDFLSKPVLQGELVARMRAGSRVVELERRLSIMARTDPLTGLATQRTFFEALETEWQRTSRYRVPLSCVMLDIDFFKRINDSYGHPAGDAVLEVVAETLASCCRATDMICRYGGEEFCAMLPETDERGAVRWAERARERLGATDIAVGKETIRVTGSFGVAQRHDDTQNCEQLVDQADQGLLCAKQSGRDKVVACSSLDSIENIELDEFDATAQLFRNVAAKHVMTPLVACLPKGETLGRATEFFLRTRINSMPVIDDQGEMVGILSEKDLMANIVSSASWNDSVDQIMKPNVVSYSEDTPVRTIYEFLCRVTIRRVVIVKDGKPTGVISRASLLRWFRNVALSKRRLDQAGNPVPDDEIDPYQSRERLAETVDELAYQATELKNRFEEDVDDLVPYIVGGATGIQELVTDLLAHSRYANRSGSPCEHAESTMLGGGCAD